MSNSKKRLFEKNKIISFVLIFSFIFNMISNITTYAQNITLSNCDIKSNEQITDQYIKEYLSYFLPQSSNMNNEIIEYFLNNKSELINSGKRLDVQVAEVRRKLFSLKSDSSMIETDTRLSNIETTTNSSIKFDNKISLRSATNYTNTSFSRAKRIYADSKISVSSNSDMGQALYFKFIPKVTGNYFIVSEGAEAEAHLYDKNHSLIEDGSSQGAWENFAMYQRLIAGNTYYILVASYETRTEYSFIIHSKLPYDDYGDSFLKASRINEGTALTGEIETFYDNDYFKFTAPTSGKYTIDMKCTKGGTAVIPEGFLFDNNKRLMGSFKFKFWQYETKGTYELKAGQTYYIKIKGASDKDLGKYILSIQRNWYYLQYKDPYSNDNIKIFTTQIGDKLLSDDMAEAKIIHNNDSLISEFTFDNGRWHENGTLAYNPDLGFGSGGIAVAYSSLRDFHTTITVPAIQFIDWEEVKNKVKKKIKEKTDIDVDKLSEEELKMLVGGIASSIDDNLYFGLVKKFTNKVDFEDNYIYMRAKSFTDACFVASFAIATYKTAADAVQAMSNAGVLGTLSLATSPAGGAGLSVGAAALEELGRSIALSTVSFISNEMLKNSQANLNNSLKKLKELFDYKVKVLHEEMKNFRHLVKIRYTPPKNAGKFYKGHGTVLDKNPLNEVRGLGGNDPIHTIERMVERNVTESDIRYTLNSAKVILSKWNGKRYLYVSNKCAVAVESTGQIVTVMDFSSYEGVLKQIWKEAF